MVLTKWKIACIVNCYARIQHFEACYIIKFFCTRLFLTLKFAKTKKGNKFIILIPMSRSKTVQLQNSSFKIVPKQLRPTILYSTLPINFKTLSKLYQKWMQCCWMYVKFCFSVHPSPSASEVTFLAGKAQSACLYKVIGACVCATPPHLVWALRLSI